MFKGEKRTERISRIKEAVQKINNGRTVRSVAREYGIPRSTLHDKINGRTPLDSTYNTELSAFEEEQLVTWIKGMTKKGFIRSKHIILDQVKKILDGQNRKTRFKDNRPRRRWYYGFLRRHPDLSGKTPTQLSSQVSSVKPDMVQNWFSNLRDYLNSEVQDSNLWEEPERWFCADETAFPLLSKTGEVAYQKGTPTNYDFATWDNHIFTVMACLSASGAYVRPMIIFSGRQFCYYPLEGFEDAVFGWSPNGLMDTELFFSWLKNVFIVHLDKNQIARPVVLFVDDHHSHSSPEATKICRENGIVLYCLLANASHILQPCDFMLFSSLKKSWKQAVSDFQDKMPGVSITSHNFAKVLKPAWEQSAKPELAIAGFRDAGLYPFNPAEVGDSHKLKPRKRFAASSTASASSPNSSTPGPTDLQSSPACVMPTTTSVHHIPPFTPSDSTHSSHLLQALDLGWKVAPRKVFCSCRQCKCPLASSAAPPQPMPSTSLTSPALLQSRFSTSTSTAFPQPSAMTVSSASKKLTQPGPSKLSFCDTQFPQVPHPTAKRQQKQDPVTKATTGKNHVNKLLQRKQRKEEKERAKQERKRDRKEKRKRREEERAERRDRREKKKMKLVPHQKTRQVLDNGGDDNIDVNVCATCNGRFVPDESQQWICCHRCPRWLHKSCTEYITLPTMSDQEEFYYECPYC